MAAAWAHAKKHTFQCLGRYYFIYTNVFLDISLEVVLVPGSVSRAGVEL